jgi:hypothetical protein
LKEERKTAASMTAGTGLQMRQEQYTTTNGIWTTSAKKLYGNFLFYDYKIIFVHCSSFLSAAIKVKMFK